MGRARSLGSTQQSVCLSCHDEHLSCPQSVWEEFFFSPLEIRGRERKSEKEGKRRRGASWGMHERKKKMEGREGRVYRFAHRLRGLCVGPGVWFSGPLAFFCSLALEKTNTH